jgi:hypothetical protein
VGSQVGGFEGNRAVGGFEFEVGFDDGHNDTQMVNSKWQNST